MTLHPLTSATFLDAVRQWEDVPHDDFPEDRPPVGAIGHEDQDRMLAQVFYRIASAPDLTTRMRWLACTIFTQNGRREYCADLGQDTGPTDAMIRRLLEWQQILLDAADAGTEPLQRKAAE